MDWISSAAQYACIYIYKYVMYIYNLQATYKFHAIPTIVSPDIFSW